MYEYFFARARTYSHGRGKVHGTSDAWLHMTIRAGLQQFQRNVLACGTSKHDRRLMCQVIAGLSIRALTAKIHSLLHRDWWSQIFNEAELR